MFETWFATVRYQMTQLLALVLLFLAATTFDINDGAAMTATMVLSLLIFVTAAGVIIIAVDPGDRDVMHRPPRDPKVPITNRSAIGVVLATDLSGLQAGLLTRPLSGGQWLACIALALILPTAVETAKAVRRKRARRPASPTGR